MAIEISDYQQTQCRSWQDFHKAQLRKTPKRQDGEGQGGTPEATRGPD
jgi:hypothetical protein